MTSGEGEGESVSRTLSRAWGEGEDGGVDMGQGGESAIH
jgi:hypothetical protein